LFEVIAILFVVFGIVSSVLQAAQKGKKTGTGFPSPARAETRRVELVEDNSSFRAKKSTRKASYKSGATQTGEIALTEEAVKPVAVPISPQAKIDTDAQYEISIDRESVLNGVIFSVILSPPKCKGMDSII